MNHALVTPRYKGDVHYGTYIERNWRSDISSFELPSYNTNSNYKGTRLIWRNVFSCAALYLLRIVFFDPSSRLSA